MFSVTVVSNYKMGQHFAPLVELRYIKKIITISNNI